MAKMSDERKGLIEWLYRFYHHWHHSCDENIEGDNGAKACEQIRNLIQQKPEIDEKYVEEKARKIGRRIAVGAPLNAIKDEITQIVSDARGGGKDGSK